VRLKIFQVLRQVANDAIDEGLSVTVVDAHKHLFGELGNLQVRFTRHVLHARVALVHKFVQLVHYSLQESPVVDEEVGELAHHVHDVGGDECLRVFCRALLAKVKQLLDHRAEKLVLFLNVHAA